MKHVEILFFEGCPHVEMATGRARQAVASAGVDADVQLVPIEGDADAVSRRFLGSPTVRVDGSDVDPSAAARSDFGVQCRVYLVDGQIEGAPPVAWIEAALRATRS